MINLILPVRIQNNFLISQTIIVIYICGWDIYIVKTEASGYKRKVVYTKNVTVENDETSVYEEKVGKRIATLLKKESYDFLKVIISSSYAIYKHITVPFTDVEKIKMITPFEVENLIPFTLTEASIEPIIISSDKKAQSSNVVAIIIKQDTLKRYQNIFKHAHIKYHTLGIESAELIAYHLNLKEQTKKQLLLYVDKKHICAITSDGKTIKSIRSVSVSPDNSDIMEVIEKTSKDMKENKEDEGEADNKLDEQKNPSPVISNTQKEEPEQNNNADQSNKTDNPDIQYIEKDNELIPFDESQKTELTEISQSQDSTNTEKITNIQSASEETIEESTTYAHKDNILQEVSETIDLLLKNQNFKPDEIRLLGDYQHISNIIPTIASLTGITPIEELNNNLESIVVTYPEGNAKSDYAACIAGSVMFKNTEHIDFDNEQEASHAESQIKNRLIVGIVLSLILICITVFWNQVKLESLKKHTKEISTETVLYIKNNFNITIKPTWSLEKAYKEAASSLDSAERIWQELVKKHNFHGIKYLARLSEMIKMEAPATHIQEIFIKAGNALEPDILTLQGYVNTFEQLKNFEAALEKTNLFERVPQAQDANFLYTLVIPYNKDWI